MQPGVREAVEAFRGAAESLYGDRFHTLVLYGSQARGDADEASDVDLMLVLEGPVQPARELDRLGGITWEIDMEHDVLLSVYPVSREEFEGEDTPLLRNVRREGVRA